jgi:urease accessory protein
VGAGPVSITRDEILTPPEFLGLISTENPSGRVGGARIELVCSDGTTQLGECYQQIPVRIMPPFQLDNESASLLYLINLTAGVLDGDAHIIELTARAGTRTVVTGQSATRVHPSGSSYSTQQWTVNVEDDACLVVMPGPTIPYQGCRYFQRARVELAESARLLWGDIWLPGRYERGELSERFQFERIVQDFEVRRTGQLVYRDRFCWDGPWTESDALWHFGPHLAVGSLFIGGPLSETLPPPTGNVQRSVFPLDTGSSCVRWCGMPAEVTADLVRVTMTIAAHWTSGPHATPWLIHSSELTPNHWFSMP